MTFEQWYTADYAKTEDEYIKLQETWDAAIKTAIHSLDDIMLYDEN